MQPQKEEDGSKIFTYGPLRGRPDMWYEHIPRCQDDPNCFRSACGYCHPERDSRNTRWTWVYPERGQPQPQYTQPQYTQPQFSQAQAQAQAQAQHFLPTPPSQPFYPKEIKSKSEAPSDLDFRAIAPRPYNPWSFNSTELRKDFGSFSLFQRPHTRFSSALKIESPPKNSENQGTHFFPSDQDKLDEKHQDIAMEDKVVKEIEKLVNDPPKVQDETVQDETVQAETAQAVPAVQDEAVQETVQDEAVQDEAVQEKPKDTSSEKEAGQVSPLIKSLNETIPTVPTPASSNSDASSKAAAVLVTARTTLEPKTASFSGTRKELHLKSKSFQKEPLSFASETTKHLRIRKLAGHDQGRAQFSLRGGSSDSKLSKSSQSLQLEKTHAIKKESSSQSLDTDASPPVEGWWEMFILKVRMLIVALCALFAVVFSTVVPKKRTGLSGTTRDNPSGASKSASVPSPSLPSTTR